MIGRIIFILIPVTAAAIGQMLLKMGMNEVGPIQLSNGIVNIAIKVFTNKFVFGGLVLFGLDTVLWLVVLSREKLSFAYPMVAFAYIVTIAMSKFILHEDVPALRWAGLGAIIIGILMIAKSSA